MKEPTMTRGCIIQYNNANRRIPRSMEAMVLGWYDKIYNPGEIYDAIDDLETHLK